MKNNEIKEFYEFADFRLDLKKQRLLKNGEIILLTHKEFEVLLMLITHAGKVVEKDELFDKIWAETFVEEGTLTRNISWLRKKLGSNSEKIIETVPKLGYRFVPEVRKIRDVPAFIVEEQTIQNISIEETLIVPEETFQTNHLQSPGNPKYFCLTMIFGTLAICLIGFFGYWYVSQKNIPQTILLANVVPLTGLPGRENMPSFSPDGKQIAFIWEGDRSNFDIYVKIIGTGEPLRLTNTPENDLFPAFSPDGKQIAFIRSNSTKSEVYLVPALGGAERKICQLNSVSSSLSFAPDGKTISVIDSDEDNKQFGVFLIDIETGQKKRLTAPPEFTSDYQSSFSPDGKQIAFLRVFNKQIIELFVLPLADGEAKQLTQDKSVIFGLTWGKDSKNIIFASRRNSNRSNLWQISAEGGEPNIIVTGGKNATNPAISSDGKNIAFVEEIRDTNIWQIDYSQHSANETKFIASSRADHSPAFSPNGKQVVFASDRSGNFEIWLADADSKNQKQLTYTGKSAGSPRFSPDGKFIAFDIQEGDKSDVFIIPVEGGQPRKITSFETRSVLPSWSADGHFIYFSSNQSGNYQLWKISVEGGEPVQLTKHGAFESFASPDGKAIYFTKVRDQAGIWKITPEGTDESAVRELEEAGLWRYWTLTNQYLRQKLFEKLKLKDEMN